MTAAYTSSTVTCMASGNAGPIAAAKPTGVGSADNGLLIAICESNTTSTTFTVPGTYVNGPFGTPSTGQQVYWRFTANGESGTENFSRSNTTGNGGVTLVYLAPGTFDQSNPLAAVVSVASAANTTAVIPSATATQADTLALQVDVSTSISGQTWTPPATITGPNAGAALTGTASGTACPYGIGTEVVGAGATGTRTWTHTGSIAQRAAMILINPAPAGGGSTTPEADVGGTLTSGTLKANVAGVLTTGTPKVDVAGVLT